MQQLAHPFITTLAQGTRGTTGAGNGNAIWYIVGGVIVVFVLILFFIVGQFIHLYIQALVSGAHVKMLDLVGMKLRKVDLRTIVYSRIRAVKAGLDISTNKIETHYLAGGR